MSYPVRTSSLMILAAWFGWGSTASGPALAAKTSAESRPALAGQAATVLRVACSDDGLRFSPTGEVFLRHAADPSLVRLANDELLALVTCTDPANAKDSSSNLWATRSRDEGKNWLPPRAVRIHGLPADTAVAHPGLLAMPSGLVRMYFAVPQKAERARANAGCVILSAVTRDGVEYQLDREVRVVCPALPAAQVSVCRGDRQTVLTAAGPTDAESGGTSGRSLAQQFTSRDGRTFAANDRARPSMGIGPVIREDAHHWRMYVSQGDEIHTRMSNDAVRWRDESGTSLKGGFDPAVVLLANHKYLMLFCAMSGKQDLSQPQLVTIENRAQPTDTRVPSPGPADGGSGSSANAPAQAEKPAASGGADPGGDKSAGAANASAGWETFASEGFDAELGADWNRTDAAEADTSTGGSMFAPVPDLRTKVDYITWYEQNCIVPDGENAFYAYGELMEQVKNRPDGLLDDRYNGKGSYGPPVLWDPAQFPAWETSYQATQEWIQQFRAGSQDTRPFSCPLKWSPDSDPEDRVLAEYLLPSLASYRAMTKATLAQAWRAESGVVPPDRMREAIETVLGNANQLQQGPTLIERLVGIAERTFAEEDARWALRRGVFTSASELESALSVLRERDQADPDVAGWIRTEHASSMDSIQYLFEPREPGGEPQLRTDHVDHLVRIYGGDQGAAPEDMDAIFRLTPEEAQSGLQDIDAFYRRMESVWRTSYPGPPSEDYDALAQEVIRKHPLSGKILPSLSRAYEISRRAEASRRATQLAYNVELHRIRYGRYPGSLDDLPADQVGDVRTDPYSGQDFGYRMTDAGPTIYSASSNGQDDGGVHSRNWGDRDTDSATDYVFWPPQEK